MTGADDDPDAVDAEAHEFEARAHALHAKAARLRVARTSAPRSDSPSHAEPAALLDKQALARVLDCSAASIDRYCAREIIPFITLGPDGPRRFMLADVLAVLGKHEAKAPTLAVATPSCEAIAGVRLLSRGGRR